MERGSKEEASKWTWKKKGERSKWGWGKNKTKEPSQSETSSSAETKSEKEKLLDEVNELIAKLLEKVRKGIGESQILSGDVISLGEATAKEAVGGVKTGAERELNKSEFELKIGNKVVDMDGSRGNHIEIANSKGDKVMKLDAYENGKLQAVCFEGKEASGGSETVTRELVDGKGVIIRREEKKQEEDERKGTLTKTDINRYNGISTYRKGVNERDIHGDWQYNENKEEAAIKLMRDDGSEITIHRRHEGGSFGKEKYYIDEEEIDNKTYKKIQSRLKKMFYTEKLGGQASVG
ncbi:hypothetical protein ACFL0Z_03745 [Patescibacteria group bacterium]